MCRRRGGGRRGGRGRGVLDSGMEHVAVGGPFIKDVLLGFSKGTASFFSKGWEEAFFFCVGSLGLVINDVERDE